MVTSMTMRAFHIFQCVEDKFMNTKTHTLPPAIQHILLEKGTEPAFSGEYCDETGHGTYLCRGCGLALYRADAKFHASCGWPSFDEAIAQAIEQRPDSDGQRIEILCARCHGHLGHVFSGEQYTNKNLRHCVNSGAVDFVHSETIVDSEEAVFAGGCFWGVQHLLNALAGVVKTEVGYTGGHAINPTYRDVCRGDTGHLEATRVIYDPVLSSYDTLTRYFLEIHDPTQADGQGPDIGSSYQSALFYYNDTQKKIAETLLQQLRNKNYTIATKIRPACVFWKAENDHQAYYEKTHKAPYCHTRVKRF